MKIFVNRDIRQLFTRLLLCIPASVLCAVLCTVFHIKWGGVICITAAGIAVPVLCYHYFKEQNRILENAVSQIKEFLSGDQNARIDCNEEGELFRLFHEVNSLAAILNAKAENEGQQKKFLQNIISDISHQLKTPLAALNIYNGIIQTEAETNQLTSIQEFAGLSEAELDRIETLVQTLLKITKFDAGSIIIEKREENISEMMKEIKEQFAFRASQEGKEIILSGSASTTLLCDRNWMMEAVRNIVKNALDHTKNGDTVKITWLPSRITIEDSGSGIHPEDLYHIFKRFYRSRYSKDTQGIGLGLPLARSVVEAHNGTIEVDSRPGSGTAFVMIFVHMPRL